MEILKPRKPHCTYNTWLRGGLLTGCMFFAPLASSEMALIDPTPPESLRSVDIPDAGAWLNARIDIRDNQPITFGVQDPWVFLHQLNLTITYDRFSGIPLTTDNDVLTGLDVTISGAAANIMSLNIQKQFQLLGSPRGKGVPTSSHNSDGVFVDGVLPDNSDDQRTFSLTLAGDPLYRGDIWSMGFGGRWENPSDTASATDYDVTVTPHYKGGISNEQRRGVVISVINFLL